MTKLLEEAIDQLRNLPDEEQDAAAHVVFSYIANDDRQFVLTPDQIAEVRRIGKTLQNKLLPTCA